MATKFDGITAEADANREWMLHEHHAWTRLAHAYGSRAEFDEACEKAISEAADGSDSPSMFERSEFVTCDYYESHYESIKPDTTHIVAVSGRNDEIQQFTNEADAQKAYDEARRDYGVERLTCDRGGHSGPSERVDVSDIRVTVTAASGTYRFEFASADEDVPAITDEIYEDKGVPESERQIIRDAIESELAQILAE